MMKRETIYRPVPFSESDIIGSHPSGALPLKEVGNVFVLTEDELKHLLKEQRLTCYYSVKLSEDIIPVVDKDSIMNAALSLNIQQ